MAMELLGNAVDLREGALVGVEAVRGTRIPKN
jgi:hypothetical protein